MTFRKSWWLRVRHLQPGESGPVDAVFAGLSAHSRYLRFHSGLPYLSEPSRQALVAVDGARHVALVAEVASIPRRQPVGIARFVETGPRRAEIAFAVVDAWHGRGVGRRLLTELRERAIRLNYREMTALVLPENRAALQLLHSVFPATTTVISDGILECTSPVAADLAAVELTTADLLRVPMPA